jgi:hypothetical protein
MLETTTPFALSWRGFRRELSASRGWLRTNRSKRGSDASRRLLNLCRRLLGRRLGVVLGVGRGLLDIGLDKRRGDSL